MFTVLQNNIQKILGPFAQRVGSNVVLKAIAQGCLATVPITIGVALVSVLINLTFDGWQAMLSSTGILSAGQEAVNVTMSMLAIYLIVTVSYNFSVLRGKTNLMATVLSLATFLILMPSTIKISDEQTIVALTSDYLGSNGIFVALLLGILITWLYTFLMDKGIKLKMPSAVPPMVADSISSCLPAIIIITGAVIVKWLLLSTTFGNLFSLIVAVIQTPFMYFGTSPLAFIIFCVFCNILWFFGIHPAAITSVYTPVIIGAVVANIEAFASGEPLPFSAIIIVYLFTNIGGNGCTLGFCLSTFFAKSEKMKALRKVVVIPNLFNINEPIIFGVPLMLNPIYLIPMVATPIVNGFVSLGIYKLFSLSLNPSFVLSFPWVTPGFIVDFAVGGIFLALTWFVCVALDFVIYLPFTMVDDQNNLKQELEVKV